MQYQGMQMKNAPVKTQHKNNVSTVSNFLPRLQILGGQLNPPSEPAISSPCGITI